MLGPRIREKVRTISSAGAAHSAVLYLQVPSFQLVGDRHEQREVHIGADPRIGRGVRVRVRGGGKGQGEVEEGPGYGPSGGWVMRDERWVMSEDER